MDGETFRKAFAPISEVLHRIANAFAEVARKFGGTQVPTDPVTAVHERLAPYPKYEVPFPDGTRRWLTVAEVALAINRGELGGIVGDVHARQGERTARSMGGVPGDVIIVIDDPIRSVDPFENGSLDFFRDFIDERPSRVTCFEGPFGNPGFRPKAQVRTLQEQVRPLVVSRDRTPIRSRPGRRGKQRS